MSTFCGIHSDSGDAENPDEAYDRFVEEIQKLIAEDDAVIIFEIGREKLNYLNGLAMFLDIVTIVKINEKCLKINIDEDL